MPAESLLSTQPYGRTCRRSTMPLLALLICLLAALGPARSTGAIAASPRSIPSRSANYTAAGAQSSHHRTSQVQTLPMVPSRLPLRRAAALGLHAPRPTSLDDLPSGLYPSVLAALQRGTSPAYRVQRTALAGTTSQYLASNPAQQLRITFTPTGLSVRHGSGQTRLRLIAAGNSHAPHPVTPVAPIAAGNRVSYRHGNLEEWYLNGPAGLEQGFTLKAPLAGQRPGEPPLRVSSGIREDQPPLVLSLALDGTLRPHQSGNTILLGGAGGLRYGGLYAADAQGRRLPASLALHGNVLRLTVRTTGAVYPITIDPTLSPQATLTGDNGDFGWSVALSADGSTALVGALTSNANAGTAYILSRGTGWTGGTASITAPVATLAAAGSGEFGNTVALSADGDTALIGAPATNSQAGAAYVFSRGTGWTGGTASTTAPVATLTIASSAFFGIGIALSADSSTALIGAGTNSTAGSAYIFTRGSGWTTSSTPQATLSAGGTVFFGYAVALSADAGTALVGAPVTNNSAGSAYIFTRGGTWATSNTPQATLTVSGSASLGVAGALSADGSTALVGSGSGAYIYSQGSGWGTDPTSTVPRATLTVAGAGTFGFAMALSADGGTALIGAPTTNSLAGAAYLFKRGSGWTTSNTPQATLAATGSGFFGDAVALSADGGTALAGAYGGSPNTAYAFVPQFSSTPAPASTIALSAALGSSSQATLTVGNGGSLDLQVGAASGLSAPLSIAPSTAFTVANTSAQPGSQLLTITCAPTSLSTSSQTLSFSTNSNESLASLSGTTITLTPSTVSYTVSCQGLQRPTTTTITTSPNPGTAVYGQLLTFAAQVVSTPSVAINEGTITFYDGVPTTTPLGTVNVGNGLASLTCGPAQSPCSTIIGAGPHTIYAVYADPGVGAGFLGSTTSNSNPVQTYTLQIAKAPTSTVLLSSANPVAVGKQLVLMAVLSTPISGITPIGTVTFYDGVTNLGTVSLVNLKVRLLAPPLTPGSHLLTAQYNGTANFMASLSAPLKQVVVKLTR